MIRGDTNVFTVIRCENKQKNFHLHSVLANIQQLVIKNEDLKKQEVKYKEQCREEMAKIQQQIR